MKTYKNIEAFEKRVRKTTDWDDFMRIGGRMYKIYEYGDRYPSGEYVYFVNKRTHDAIKVEYALPKVNYKNGVRIEEGQYRFHDIVVIPEMDLWRTDTL